MQPGDRVAGRFQLDRLGGAGGMGAVWRAQDLETGELCALKVVLNHDAAQVARFQREAWTLAQLDHPGIARHVAHGVTQDGRPYLAMEWLDGEDLAARLRRGPIGAEQALAFARRVAEALEAVHAAGIVHRDLKPGNLFLPGGDLERVKLLDFGISRHVDATYGLTDPGAPLGTPAYMAPEQVRGDVEIDARADVYALGCVLFECLAGRPPYVAAHPLAVLAKILFEEAPRPSELSPDVPAALDPLVARLIAKDAARRPPDGRALAAELRSWCRRDWRSAPEAPPPAQALTGNERRLVSVILAAEVRDGERGPASIRLHPGLLTPRPHRDAHTLDAPSTVPAAYLPLLASLREAADHYGARLEVLRDGSVAAVLSGAPSPLDLAASGARCALAIRALLPNAWVALATSWGVVESGQPIGQVIDRAGALLDTRAATVPPASRPVLLDSMTAALLGPRFELRSDPLGSPHPGLRADEPRYAPGPVLLAEREAAEVARALLGRPTPCLGRDRELRALEDLFDDCAAEPRAHAAVITGPAGVGKSRLRAELTRRLLARNQRLEIWLGRGDPLRAGAPLGLLAQMICRTAQIQGGEPIEDRRSKLAARVARSVEPHAAARVAEFLGEMIGTPFPDESSVELAAARKDALLLGDQMRRAFLDLLAGACRDQPVLLILEDLHWGDAPSVEYVDAALRLLDDQPLLVLALGRPELRDVFPALWAEREATEMRLGELPRRACERLVRAALGVDLPDDRVAMIVERASGNAFFLEELVRAEADGRGEADAPATVLAMLQGRLDAQGADARRVLRAASILGDVFWRGAVARLTGEVRRPGSIDAVLADLERRELITRRPDSRFHGEVEYRFRHSLVREAAYGMLTDEDRALGHRLAAAWLEGMGERDAMVLAEHLEKGGEEARAVEQYRRAAEQALGANDLSAARARANRAITRGATGALLGELHLVRAETLRWCGELLDAEESALLALSVFPIGTARWCDAATELCGAASRLGHRDQVVEVARALEAGWDDHGGGAAQVVAMASIASTLLHLGERELAAGPAARAETAAAALAAGDITSDPAVPSDRAPPPPDPAVRLAILRMRAVQAMLDGDVAAAHRRFEELAAAQEAAGNLRRACQHRVSEAMMLIELGDHEEAIEVLRAALSQAERLGITSLEAMAKGHLGLALALNGDSAAARILTEEAVVYFFVRGDRRLEAGYRTNLARILRVTGDLHGAVIESRRAEGALAVVPPLRPYALAVLAEARFLSGDHAEALARAAEAVALMDRVQLVEQGEALARLIHAEALDAAGEHAAARAALSAARARLLERASWIPDARQRATFLEAVPENARTLALAAAWLDGEGEAGRAVGA